MAVGQRRQTLQVDQWRQDIMRGSGGWEAQYTGRRMNHTAPEPSLGDIHHQPPTHDPVACARWWQGRGAPQVSAWLHDEVARRMQERLGWIKLQPRDWVDANPSIGGCLVHAAIAQRYPQAQAYVHEPSPRRVRWSRELLSPQGLQAWLPWKKKPIWLAPGQWPEPVDMVWANMQLHLHPEPELLLREWHRALRVDGFAMFSGLGPDSLMELRQVYELMGWPAAGSAWTDMHDWGDMLVQVGFAEPVMDMERITLSYASAAALVDELRTLGRNLHPQRFPACRGKGWRVRLEQAIQNHWPKRSAQGQFLLTFEIVYGHALRAQDRHQVDTTTRISLGEMKKMLRPD
jgi:malonyl-CoA O-methyltransferase